MLPSRYGAAKIRLVTKVLIDEVIFTADEYTTGAIIPPRDADKHVGRILKGLTVLTDDMVEAEIQLIEGQHLLSYLSCFTSWVIISFLEKERDRYRELANSECMFQACSWLVLSHAQTPTG